MKTVIFAGFVVAAGIFAGAHFSRAVQGTDFPQFYCAARMLGEGSGRELYDLAVQEQYQARYAGRAGTPYTHPPFEAAAYGVVAWLPLRQGYILWFLLNLGFVAMAAQRLARDAPGWLGNWRLLFAASLMFVPVLLCLQQAQDSVLLLMLAILALEMLKRGRGFSAGCWLGLALFKFQIALPLALVLVLEAGAEQRGRLARGFACVGLVLAAVSAFLCGWRVFIEYPRFVIGFGSQPYAGMHPEAMANFRGLTSLMLGREYSTWGMIMVCGLSFAALLWTVWVGRRATGRAGAGVIPAREFDSVFCSAVLFALLASYHLNPHDLSLALLPMFLMLKQSCPWAGGGRNWLLAIGIAALLVPALGVWALRTGVYGLMVIPVTGLFLLGVTGSSESRADSKPRHL